jgi:hypothetical protein
VPSPRRPKKRPLPDALAPELTEVQRRTKAKVYLRQYLLGGCSPVEAQELVMRHPDFAANPPSPRSLQVWTRQLRLAPGGDLVDEEVRAMLAHPIEDHRKAQLDAIAGRLERHNLVIAGLQANLLAAEEASDAERAAELRREIREEDKRIGEASELYARITGTTAIPLEAHLGEAEARTRLVEALAANTREFDLAELRAVATAFSAEIARRELLAAESWLPGSGCWIRDCAPPRARAPRAARLQPLGARAH